MMIVKLSTLIKAWDIIYMDEVDFGFDDFTQALVFGGFTVENDIQQEQPVHD